MKSHSILFAGLLSFFLIACSSSTENPQANETETQIVEEEIPEFVQQVEWTGKVAGMYEHFGTVQFSEVKLDHEKGFVKGGSFVVDMSSMQATDENYNEEEGKTADKLIGHLQSADFFDVENHPKATFKITEVSEDGSMVTGQMTIRGVSNEVIVKTEQANHPNVKGIVGTLVFDRKDFDVAFDHPAQDIVINDEVELKIYLILS